MRITLGGMAITGTAIAFLVAIALTMVGAWLLRSVQRAKETGVARFPVQWPTGFSRDEHPIHFKASVMRNTIVGVGFCAMAGAIVVFALLSLAF